MQQVRRKCWTSTSEFKFGILSLKMIEFSTQANQLCQDQFSYFETLCCWHVRQGQLKDFGSSYFLHSSVWKDKVFPQQGNRYSFHELLPPLLVGNGLISRVHSHSEGIWITQTSHATSHWSTTLKHHADCTTRARGNYNTRRLVRLAWFKGRD